MIAPAFTALFILCLMLACQLPTNRALTPSISPAFLPDNSANRGVNVGFPGVVGEWANLPQVTASPPSFKPMTSPLRMSLPPYFI